MCRWIRVCVCVRVCMCAGKHIDTNRVMEFLAKKLCSQWNVKNSKSLPLLMRRMEEFL